MPGVVLGIGATGTSQAWADGSHPRTETRDALMPDFIAATIRGHQALER